MGKAYYLVYCKYLLGVKSNVEDFRWIYGSNLLNGSEEEYAKCVVKLNITVVPEKKLEKRESYDKKFQSYMWNAETETLCCKRTIFGLPIGYNIRLEGNMIYADIGQNYYRLVKNRMMNLHGVYYLLADLANIVLLNSGYLTLYASAVADKATNRGIVNFAPPNTGKTVTAMMLCKELGYSLVSEDVIITDGKYIYGCPWTNSYRNPKSNLDSVGAVCREKRGSEQKTCDVCKVTDLIALSSGKSEVNSNKDEMLRQIKILNGYLFNYYSSPIVKILSYFDKKYCVPWAEKAEEILTDMVERCDCRCIQAENPMDFYQLVALKEESKE